LTLEIAQIDAFTDRPFSGNPAAVCIVGSDATDRWMQDLAAEMNLSETAFLSPVPGASTDEWNLRWFTPTIEVDLCGHATLAAAHYLFTRVGLDHEVLRFHTRSGVLEAARTDDSIELELPADPTVTVAAPTGLLDALRLSEGVVSVSRGKANVVVEVTSGDVVRAIEPDFEALAAVDAPAIVVTAVGEGLYDVISRFFAPLAGIDEDPVTGSAHCTLASYWAPMLGKDGLLAYQASARGGVVRMTLRGDRVLLGGSAVTVFVAELADQAATPADQSAVGA
jgi:PhzF family phenazine biosynthesis protein